MTLIAFIRLVLKHLRLLIVLPVLISLTVYFFYNEEQQDFKTTSTLYTGFASGYNITSSSGRMDFFAVKTKFDNLFALVKSRSVQEEIALKLLTFYLESDSISEKSMTSDQQELFLSTLEEYDLLSDLDAVPEGDLYSVISAYYYKDVFNPLYFLINSNDSPLRDIIGLSKIGAIEVYQDGTSDRIVLNYNSTDPGVGYHTLRIAIEVIIRNAKLIKSQESDDVVAYFKREAAKAKARLLEAEEELSLFMTSNNVINYYEQTKWLASRNEDFQVAYQEEKLRHSAAKAAERESVKSLEASRLLKQKRGEISELREKLREVSGLLAFLDVKKSAQMDTLFQNLHRMESDTIIALRKEKKIIKENLKNSLEDMYDMGFSSNGINIELTKTKWLEAIIKVEECGAKLKEYEVFKKEFEITYTRFARLGSKIKQMERGINVLERDYLDLLASLNDAKLKRQNVQMMADLKIVDKAFYPVDASKSKRALFTILGLVGGFVLVLAILLTLEFLDDSIKTPERAEEKTRLKLVAGLPFIGKEMEEEYPGLLGRLKNQLVAFLNNEFWNRGRKKPFIVLINSTREIEGKTRIGSWLESGFKELGDEVCFIKPATENEEENTYPVTGSLCNMDLNKLQELAGIQKEDYKYVFIELPSLIGKDMPTALLNEANLSLMILKSSRLWNAADKKALDTYKSMINHEIFGMINGCEVVNLEGIIGEVPKKRTKFRMKIKQWASLKLTKNTF